MDFSQRLQKAIERGARARREKAAAAAEREITEEELRRLHLEARLGVSEHIERCLRELAEHFPGFRYDTIVSADGWGAAIRREDLRVQRGARQPNNLFSRLEMIVRPYSSAQVLELAAKATIRDKELFNRNHYQRLSEADVDTFKEMIDLWALEYAEAFAKSD